MKLLIRKANPGEIYSNNAEGKTVVSVSDERGIMVQLVILVLPPDTLAVEL